VTEEFGTKYDQRVIIAVDVGKIEHDIRTLSDNLFLPGSGVKTVSGLSVPDELSLASLCICPGGEKVLAAVSIYIYPNARVIEESGLVWRYLVEGLLALQIGLEHIDVTVGLAGGEEPVGHHDGVCSGEHVFGDDGDAVGPLEGARKHLALEVAELNLTLEGVPDVGDNRHLSRGESAELRDQQELRLVLELLHRDKSRRVSYDRAQQSVRDVSCDTHLHKEGRTKKIED
jgi:hypothetical protein